MRGSSTAKRNAAFNHHPSQRDSLQPHVKGPLLTTDVVVWHLGWGMQLTPPGAFKISANIRRKAPGLYPPNEENLKRYKDWVSRR